MHASSLRGTVPAGLMPSLATVGVALFGLVAFAFLTVPAVDSDYGWHVANGRHLLDGQLFGGVDTYSWTAPGATWIAHEWLTEGVMAFIHDSLGPTWNSILAGGLAALAMVLVVARLRLRGFGTVVALAVGTIAMLDAGTIVSVRPIVVEVLAVSLLLWRLDAWRDGLVRDRRLTLELILLFLVWANAHGSFVLGLGILGATSLSLVIARSGRAWVVLTIGLAAACVTLVNPFGIHLLGYVASAVTGSRLALIDEWATPNLGEPMWFAFDAALLLSALGLVAALRTRAGSQTTHASGRRAMRLNDALIAVVMGIEGLLHGYHAGMLGIVAAPLMAAGITAIVPAIAPDRSMPPAPSSGRRAAANLGVLGLVAVLTAALTWVRVGPSNTAAAIAAEYPIGALPALDLLTAAGAQPLRLFNEYAWGGWLEMARPDIPVFIDGRSEVYGDAQVARYALIAGARPGWEAALASTGANAILVRTSSALVPALTRRGWSPVYQDDVATLLTYAAFASTDTASRQAMTPAATCQTDGIAT